MNKFLISLSAVLALAMPPAFAQAQAQAPSPDAQAAVRELLGAMKYREQMDAAFKSMQKQIPVMVLQKATNGINANTALSAEEKKAALDKVAKEVPGAIESVNALLGDPKLVDEIIEEIIPIYANHFTVQEMGQLAAFYKTAAGTKLLTTMPQVLAESTEIANRVMGPRIAKYINKAASAK